MDVVATKQNGVTQMQSGGATRIVASKTSAEVLPKLFVQGFRPFFLAAGLWAISALAVWMFMLTTGASLPSRFDPLDWHIHEMLFGFVMAAIAGFLLTAIPNWTGRPSIGGRPLAALAGLWLLGRMVCLASALIPFWLAAAADLAFPVALAAVAGCEIIGGRNLRNLPMLVPVGVLGIANLLMHLEADNVAVPTGLGWRLSVAVVVILISVVSGRIVPTFTRNWLLKRNVAKLPATHGFIDRIALGSLHLGLLGWIFGLAPRIVGSLLLLGAFMNLWRLVRWRGTATAREPLLLVLHVGYGWLVIGVALLGLATLGVDVPFSAAIHALTVGAFGTMILAVMTRATLGHTGRILAADWVTGLTYVMINLSAVIRLCAAFAPEWATSLLLASASLWIGCFCMFVWRYGPFLLSPRHVP